MKTLLVAIVSAALLAAIGTQLVDTLLADNRIALLIVLFLVGTATALVTVRFGARQQPQRGRSASYRPVRERQPRPPKGAKREQGAVKWFSPRKGYGFIVRENGEDIFVHHRSIRGGRGERPELHDGQTVTFVAVERQRGWQAEDVAIE